MIPFKRILCPIDFSELSFGALDAADKLASCFSADLSVLHVAPGVRFMPPSTALPTSDDSGFEDKSVGLLKRSLDEIISQKVPQGLRVRSVVLTGDDVADQILKHADEEQVDLKVIASHGITGWRRFVLGSVAEKVLKRAARPVLLIQPSNEKS